VTNYGYQIDEGRIPYKLYYRNKELTRGETRGKGIGLWVAKEIAKSLDIELKHKCNLIWDHNIPLVHRYMLFARNKEEEIYKTVLRKYSELYRSGIREQVLSKRSDFNLLRKEKTENEINWPTFEVTFEVII
jgi:hypothetical protein